MVLNVVYWKFAPPYSIFDNSIKRYRKSTPLYPSVYGDLLNFVVFHSANQSYKMMDFNIEARMRYDDLGAKSELDMQIQGTNLRIINTTVWTPSNIITQLSLHIVSGKPLSYSLNIWQMFTLVGYKALIVLFIHVIIISIISYVSEKNNLTRLIKTSTKAKIRSTRTKFSNELREENKLWAHIGMVTLISLFKPSKYIPKSSRSRMLLGTWFICIFFIIQFLSSFVISEIAFLGVPQRIESLADLAKNAQIRPIFSGLTKKTILSSPGPDELNIVDRAIRHKSLMRFPQEFQKLDSDVAPGGAVVLGERYGSLLAITKCQRKGFYMSQLAFRNLKPALYFNLNLNYSIKENMNKRILVFQEGGFVTLVDSHIMRLTGAYMSEDRGMQASPFKVVHQAPAYVFFLFGCLWSLVFLIAETIYNSINSWKQFLK